MTGGRVREVKYADLVLRVQEAWAYNGSLFLQESSFQPIPELERYDADVFLFFLVPNGVLFASPTNDPWYRATTPVGDVTGTISVTSSETMEAYYSDEPASPLACMEQEQFCNPNLPEDSRCTLLSGTFDVGSAASNLFQGNASSNRFFWAYKAGFASSILLNWVVGILGSQALTARDSLSCGMQGSLPDNQWQLEVQHWHETSLASLQAFFINTATGPNDQQVLQWFQGPNNTEEYTLCKNQVCSLFRPFKWAEFCQLTAIS
jgi:hypothetical protein